MTRWREEPSHKSCDDDHADDYNCDQVAGGARGGGATKKCDERAKQARAQVLPHCHRYVDGDGDADDDDADDDDDVDDDGNDVGDNVDKIDDDDDVNGDL